MVEPILLFFRSSLIHYKILLPFTPCRFSCSDHHFYVYKRKRSTSTKPFEIAMSFLLVYERHVEVLLSPCCWNVSTVPLMWLAAPYALRERPLSTKPDARAFISTPFLIFRHHFLYIRDKDSTSSKAFHLAVDQSYLDDTQSTYQRRKLMWKDHESQFYPHR